MIGMTSNNPLECFHITLDLWIDVTSSSAERSCLPSSPPSRWPANHLSSISGRCFCDSHVLQAIQSSAMHGLCPQANPSLAHLRRPSCLAPALHQPRAFPCSLLQPFVTTLSVCAPSCYQRFTCDGERARKLVI
jgi:hypothetical protein